MPVTLRHELHQGLSGPLNKPITVPPAVLEQRRLATTILVQIVLDALDSVARW
jgi:hypothetical protein